MKILCFVCFTLLAGLAAGASALAQEQPSPGPSAFPIELPSQASPPAGPAPASTSTPDVRVTAASPWQPYSRYALLTPLAVTHVTSELTPGTTTLGGFNVDSAAEFKIWRVRSMMGFDFHQVTYRHPDRYPVPAIGGGTTIFPALTATEYEYGFRGGIAAIPHTYLAFNSIFVPNNYGNPELIGYEYGIERLPDFSQPISFHGKLYYTGNLFNEFNFVVHSTGRTVPVSYTNWEYEVGAIYAVPNRPFLLDLGYRGFARGIRQNAPANIQETGPYLALGFRL